MSDFIRMLGVGVMVCGGFGILCWFAWLVCEAVFWFQDRIFTIFRLQKSICRYLINHKLYDKLIDEHLKAKGGTN